jgi:SAM-dependent methyltransferase
LQALIPEQASVLEIGSGTGQHAVFFTQNMPRLLWQPSDRQEYLDTLEARFDAQGDDNILPPLQLDVLRDPWPDYIYDAAFSANTAHIMPWDAVVAMIEGVASHLDSGARFCLYGPFNVDGRFTSESNAHFDARLRAEDSNMGIRDMTAMESLANLNQMSLEQKIAMPANNFILVFRKS